MKLFDILKNLYTNPKSDWILKVKDKDINPVVIQRFLALNPSIKGQTAMLNKFVYTLSGQMYLSAAWTVLLFNGKKTKKTPYYRYPKEKKKKYRYYFIINKIKKQFKLSEKDIETNIDFINKAIKENPIFWFSYYGIKKEHWLSAGLDIEHIKYYKK